MNSKTKLLDADIFLRCHDIPHKSNCIKLRDSLLNNFNEVYNAQVVETISGKEDYCVYGTAKINSTKTLLFEKALSNMPYSTNKTLSKKPIKNISNNKPITKSIKVLYSI